MSKPDNLTFTKRLDAISNALYSFNQIIERGEYKIGSNIAKEAFDNAYYVFKEIALPDINPGTIQIEDKHIESVKTLARWLELEGSQKDAPESLKHLALLFKNDTDLIEDVEKTLRLCKEYVQGHAPVEENAPSPEDGFVDDELNIIGLNGKRPQLEDLEKMPAEDIPADNVISSLLWISSNALLANHLGFDKEINEKYFAESERIFMDIVENSSLEYRTKFAIALTRYRESIEKQLEINMAKYRESAPDGTDPELYAHIKLTEDPLFYARSNIHLITGKLSLEGIHEELQFITRQKHPSKEGQLKQPSYITTLAESDALSQFFKNYGMKDFEKQQEQKFLTENADRILYNSGFLDGSKFVSQYKENQEKIAEYQKTTKLDLSDPYVARLYLKLQKNIELFKKCDPEFTITQDEIDAMLSPERIALHQKALSNVSVASKVEGASKKLNNALGPELLPNDYSRNLHYLFNPNNDADIEQQVIDMVSVIGRDDEAGLDAKAQYIKKAFAAIDKLGLDKKDKLTEEDILDISLNNGFDAGLVMDLEAIVSNSVNFFKLSETGKEKFNVLKNYCKVGGTLRDAQNVFSDEDFLTVPFYNITDNTFGGIISNLGKHLKEELGEDSEVYANELAYKFQAKLAARFIPLRDTLEQLNQDKHIISPLNENDYTVVNVYEKIAPGFDAVRQNTINICDEITRLKDDKYADLKAKAQDVIDKFSSAGYHPDEKQCREIFKSIEAIKQEVNKQLKALKAANDDSPESKFMKGLFEDFRLNSSSVSSEKLFISLVNSQKADTESIPEMKDFTEKLDSAIKEGKIVATSGLGAAAANALEGINAKLNNAGLKPLEKARLLASKRRLESFERKFGQGGLIINSPVSEAIFEADGVRPYAMNPANVINYIENKFNLNEFGDIPLDKYTPVKESLANLSKSVRQALEGNTSTENVIDSMSSAINEIKDLISYGVSEDARAVLESFLLPLNQYSNALSKANETEVKPSLSEILSDNSWMSGLLNEPDEKLIESWKDKGNYDPSQHDLKENIDLYKEKIQGLPEKFNEQLGIIAGSKVNPEKVFKDKMELMAAGINIYTNPVFGHAQFEGKHVSQSVVAHNNSLNLFKTSNNGNIANYMSGLSYDNTLNRIGLGELRSTVKNRSYYDKTTKDVVNNLIKKAPVKGEFLGLDDDSKAKLDDLFSSVFGVCSSIQRVTRNPLSNMNDNPYADEDHPMHGIALVEKGIFDKLNSYINGKDNVELPGKEDYDILYNAMEMCIEHSELFVKDYDGDYSLHKSYTDLFESINYLKTNHSDKFSRDLDLLSSKLKNRIDKECEKIVTDTIKQIGKDSQPDIDQLSKFNAVFQSDMLSDAMKQKLIFMRMAVDYEFRNAYMKDAADAIKSLSEGRKSVSSKFNTSNYTPETHTMVKVSDMVHSVYVFGKMLEAENNQYDNRKSSNGDIAVSPALKPFLNVSTITGNDVKALSAYIDRLRSDKEFQSVVNGLSKYLNGKDADDISQEIINSKCLLNDPDLDIKKHIAALTQLDRTVKFAGPLGYKYENSGSYNAIGSSIMAIREKEHNLEVLETADYLPLFDSLKNYVMEHDCNPSTDVGKQRMSDAINMMVKLGMELRNTNNLSQAQNDDIAKNIKLAILRSPEIRKNLTFAKNNFDLAEYALKADNLLKDKGYPGKLTEREANALLAKHTSLDQKTEDPQLREVLEDHIKMRAVAHQTNNVVTFNDLKKRSSNPQYMDYVHKAKVLYDKARQRHEKIVGYGSIGLSGVGHSGLEHMLDMSGTEEAEKNNIEFVEMTGTDEGSYIYLNKMYEQIINADFDDIYSVTIDESVNNYVNHADELSVGFVAPRVSDGMGISFISELGSFSKDVKGIAETMQNNIAIGELFGSGVSSAIRLDNKEVGSGVTSKTVNAEQMQANRSVDMLGHFNSNINKRSSVKALKEQGIITEKPVFYNAYKIAEDGSEEQIAFDDAVEAYDSSRGRIVFRKKSQEEIAELTEKLKNPFDKSKLKYKYDPLTGKDLIKYLQEVKTKLVEMPHKELMDSQKYESIISKIDEGIDANEMDFEAAHDYMISLSGAFENLSENNNARYKGLPPKENVFDIVTRDIKRHASTYALETYKVKHMEVGIKLPEQKNLPRTLKQDANLKIWQALNKTLVKLDKLADENYKDPNKDARIATNLCVVNYLAKCRANVDKIKSVEQLNAMLDITDADNKSYILSDYDNMLKYMKSQSMNGIRKMLKENAGIHMMNTVANGLDEMFKTRDMGVPKLRGAALEDFEIIENPDVLLHNEPGRKS